MKTLSVLSCKGGTGKTTLALHMAVAAQRAGRATLVADLDRQRACLDWRRERDEVKPAVEEAKPGSLFTLQLAAGRLGTDLMIIDTATSREEDSAYAIKCADLCLIVVRPSFLDLKSVVGSAQAVLNQCKQAVFVVNQAQSGAGMAEVLTALRPYGIPVAPTPIRMRNTYQQGVGEGRTAQELEPGGAAACEVGQLWSYVEGLLWPSVEAEAPLYAYSA
ncbi:MAG TPA: division plane positioning ATPase MipZ [Caulobacteraceae bacterium]|nr:division plane positioning ATPase MipZ [Caulobacteraceae bacterium]